ncbi:MAG: hypothetical protein Q9188_004104 [Gyalolechia gomerana]
MAQTQSGLWKREGQEQFMVTRESAVLYTANETLVGCDDDHSQIAKVKRAEGGAWYAICAAMRKAFDEQNTLAVPTKSINTRPSSLPTTPIRSRHQFKAVPGSEHISNSDFANQRGRPASHLQTELCSAVKAGNVDAVQRPMDKGARVHTSQEGKLELACDPYLLAAYHRQDRILNILVNYRPDPTKCELRRRRTALHLVFLNQECGDTQGPTMKPLIAMLLRSRLVLDARDGKGRTPLLYGARWSNVEAVTCLLDHGANLKVTDDSGDGVLHWAARSGKQVEVLNLLISKGAPKELKNDEGYAPLACGVRQQSKAVVRCLLSRGANIESTVSDGKTPLIISSIWGKVEPARCLLSNGAKVSKSDNKGWTALHYAVWNGYPEILDLLIYTSSSYPIDPVNIGGATPLHLSAVPSQKSKSRGKCARLLLQAGARTDIRDNCHKTALHWATEYGNVDVIKALLQAGAKTDIRDKFHQTALHWAARCGDVDTVKVLLAFGADIEAQTDPEHRRRALHYAKFFGHPEVVKILLQNSADPFAKDSNGRRPSQLGWAEDGVDRKIKSSSEEEKAQCMRLLKDGEKAWEKLASALRF